MSVHELPGERLPASQATEAASLRLWAMLIAAGVAPATAKESLGNHEARSPREYIPLVMPGRCMISAGREFACETAHFSPFGLAIRGAAAGSLGDWAVAYIDDVGRIEGVVADSKPIGFVLAIQAEAGKLDRIARKICWLAKHQMYGTPERRAYKRTEPHQVTVILRSLDGRAFLAELTDISDGGAALAVDVELPLGTPVKIDGRPAHVVRRFPNGVAVKFDR